MVVFDSLGALEVAGAEAFVEADPPEVVLVVVLVVPLVVDEVPEEVFEEALSDE